MIELIKQTVEPKKFTKCMHEMKPLEVCVVADPRNPFFDHVVLRTSSSTKFEVMDLSDPNISCWEGKPTIRVRPLYDNEEYTLRLTR